MEQYLLAIVASVSATVAATVYLVPFTAKRLGLIGVDIHKPHRPRVPEAGGVGLLAGLLAGFLTAYALTGSTVFLVLILTALGAWMVGFIDDLVRLDAISKPAMTIAASLPILAFNVYTPHLLLPLVGEFRLTIVYPLIVILLVTVSANMFNMVDVLNGSMVFSALVVLSFTALAAAILGRATSDSILAWLIVVSVLATYSLFNFYPARVFNGDSGSLMVGAIAASLSILLRVEAFYVLAALPLVLNGFQILASVGGLRERREMPRPTRLRSHCIEASPDPRAPITLVQLVTLKNCLSEVEVVAAIVALIVVSGLAMLGVLALHLLLAG